MSDNIEGELQHQATLLEEVAAAALPETPGGAAAAPTSTGLFFLLRDLAASLRARDYDTAIGQVRTLLDVLLGVAGGEPTPARAMADVSRAGELGINLDQIANLVIGVLTALLRRRLGL